VSDRVSHKSPKATNLGSTWARRMNSYHRNHYSSIVASRAKKKHCLIYWFLRFNGFDQTM
jgi:hypothetical protein